MATDYGGQAAYGAQAWQGGQPGSGAQSGLGGQPASASLPGPGPGPGPGTGPGPRRRRGRARAVAVTILILGVAGLGVSLAAVAAQVFPRQFTAHQQRQILDWEVSKRWRDLTAGQIFPALVHYPAPSELGGSALLLTAGRIGIASQASCPKAADTTVAAVLERNGCQAMLRATYADLTESYVVTVGVAAFPGSAQASAAHRELPSLMRNDRVVAGVRPVRFSGTRAALFTDRQRRISANTNAGTYVVFYTIGYADQRPQDLSVPPGSYTYSEMDSLGAGVAQAVVSALAKPPPSPRCPGTPGC